MTNIGISVIIPNYNGEKFLLPCLSSLIKAINNCPKIKFETILIDNGSSDNSQDIFTNFCTINHLPSQIISLNTNFGFAKAVNIGINAAKYDLVCLTNNDLIIDSNWFKYVTKSMPTADSKTAVYCGTVLNKTGTHFESQGFKYHMSGKCININNGLSFSSNALSLHSSSVPIWGSSAALVIYKKEIIQKIGLFDEKFFAYLEDVDLSYRLNHLGYKTILVPNAVCYHLGGGTSNKTPCFRQYYTFRNWHLLILKNYTLKEFIKYLFPIVIERLRNLSYLFKNCPPHLLLFKIIKICANIIINLPHIIRQRQWLSALLKLNQS